MEGKDETLSTDVLPTSSNPVGEETVIAIDWTTSREPPVLVPVKVISDEAWERAFTAWRDGYLRSSPVAQNTEGWNHLHSVMGRFRELLEAELKVR